MDRISNQGKLNLTITTDTLQLFIGVLLVLWLNAGNSTFVVDKIPSVIKLGLILLWFFLACFHDRTFLNYYISIGFPILTFCVIILSAMMLGRSDYYNLYFQTFMYIAILTGLFAYYYYVGTKKEIKVILTVYFLDTCIVVLRTFIELLTNPSIARAISTGSGLKEELLGGSVPNGIGGYGLCYALVFIMATLLLSNGFWNKYKVPKILMCIFVLAFLFMAQLTMALLLYVFVIGVSIIVFRAENSSGWIVKLILVFFLALFMFNITNILEWAISIGSDSIADRLNEVLMLFQSSGSSTGDDTASRIELYTQSITAFLNSPFIGSWGNRSYGCHSTFFDMLAAFGCFGFFGIYGLVKPLVLSRNTLSGEMRLSLLIVILIYVFFSCINVSHVSEISTVVILIIPLFYRYTEMDKEAEIDEDYSN